MLILHYILRMNTNRLIFWIRKMKIFEKITTRWMLQQLPRLEFPPLVPLGFSQQTGAGSNGMDGLFTLRWRETVYTFAVYCRTRSTPKTMQELFDQVKRARSSGPPPLVLVPFLSESQLIRLEDEGISGLDLSGNGVLVLPDRLLVMRTGRPNRHPQSVPIRNVYRGTSSLVARLFLLRESFETVSGIQTAIAELGGSVSLSTISKVVARLEEDLMVAKTARTARGVAISVLQPDKLLETLRRHYQRPAIRRRVAGKWTGADAPMLESLRKAARRGGGDGVRLVRTGVHSAERYAVMAREPALSFYCSDLSGIQDVLADVRETDRFPDVEFLETEDDTVYFDARSDLYASPVQAYLELASGDRRETEAAEQVAARLLRDLDRCGDG